MRENPTPMQQILLFIPGTEWLVSTTGVAVPAFGIMLFLCFVLTALVWGPSRVKHLNLSPERLQDLAIVLFVTGLVGARALYMIQYRREFQGGTLELIKQFFMFWNGGIVVYGSVIGGLIGYAVFYRKVLKPLGINGWKLADAVAPLIALGLAVGRIGCYLNGCCWGQPVCPEAQPVPLLAELGEFPLLPSYAREQVCRVPTGEDRLPQIRGQQTSTGFAIAPRPAFGLGDPRTLITALEPGSGAAKAGLRPGDLVVGLDGKPNAILIDVSGPGDVPTRALRLLVKDGGSGTERPMPAESGVGRAAFDSPEAYQAAARLLGDLRADGLSTAASDDLADRVREDRFRRKSLTLEVKRGDSTATVTYTPRTVSFFPTQLYETVSMLLLIGVLLTLQPLTTRDGELMVALMLGYACHRFLNEAIRIEPTYALGLTLSQWISVGIFLAGLGLEVYLRRASRPVVKETSPPGPLSQEERG